MPQPIRTSIISLLAYLAGSGLVAEAGMATDLRYEWPYVPSAAYYSGTYQIQDRITDFRTKSNWLMLEQPAVVKVRAIGRQDDFLMSFTLTTPTPLPGPSDRPVLQAMAVPTQQGKSAATTRSDGEGDEHEMTDDEVTSDVLEHGDATPTQTVQKKRASRFQITVNGTLGHEALRAAGGITDYSAASGIFGAAVKAEWQNKEDFWYLAGAAEIHRLNVSERVVTADGSGNGSSSSTFMRTFDTVGAFYDLRNGISNKDSRIGFGAGLAYMRLPMLQAEAGANQGKLKQESAYGPYFAADLSVPAFTNGRLGLDLELMPTTMVRSTRATAIHGQGFATSALSKHWHIQFTLDFQREFLRRDGDCPAIDTCANEMTANSTVIYGSAGLGYHF